MNVSLLVIPIIVLLIVVYGKIKGVDVLSAFSQGAKYGLSVATELLPTLAGLMLLVNIIMASGLADFLCRLISPISEKIGLSSDVLPLCLISPVSGSGSIAVYENILNKFGPESVQGQIASVIAGATETSFYAISVYLGSVGIKNSGRVLPFALFGDVISFICAALTVRFFM